MFAAMALRMTADKLTHTIVGPARLIGSIMHLVASALLVSLKKSALSILLAMSRTNMPAIKKTTGSNK